MVKIKFSAQARRGLSKDAGKTIVAALQPVAEYCAPGSPYLKKLREGLDLSQSTLGTKSGISRAVIANVESKRHGMSPSDATKIFTALALTISPKSDTEKYRDEARQIALELIAFKRRSLRLEVDVDIAGQIKALEKRREEAEAQISELETSEFRLKAEN